MPRHVSIPARPGFASADVYVRLSTPGNHEASAVDPKYPSAVFIPTIWTDSFIYYPQFDDPAFYDHYNLISIDPRGHGLTTISYEKDKDLSYNWRDVGDDVMAVIEALGVSKAHVVAMTLACISAVHLAVKYHSAISSVSLVNPPPGRADEPFSWGLAFEECDEHLLSALRQDDMDSLDAITSALFAFTVGPFQNSAIDDLKQEYKDLVRSKVASGELERCEPLILSLLRGRNDIHGVEDAKLIQCPVMILHGTEDGCSTIDEENQFAAAINANPYDRATASLHVVEGLPRWMTLTSPNIVNPLLTGFITTPSTPLSPQMSLSTKSISRRPSTPRDLSFIVPTIPKITPNTLTMGDYLDQQAAGGDAMRKKARSFSLDSGGVRIAVEVLVMVDGEEVREVM